MGEVTIYSTPLREVVNRDDWVGFAFHILAATPAACGNRDYGVAAGFKLPQISPLSPTEGT
jgi:hypothetical protein